MAIYHLSHTYVGRSTQKQAHTSSAHLNYITRPTRATDIMGARMPTTWREAGAWLREQEDGDRKNARIIDKIEIALPRELTHEQNAALVREFSEELTRGRVPWLAAMHDGPKDADNPHAHIILRDRDFETGRRVMLTTERGTIDQIREKWETHANLALEQAGHEARIDRRTLEAQGSDREAQIHVGPKNRVFEEKGYIPESKPLEVRRIDFYSGDQRPIIIDYPAIDQGRTRAEFNQEIRFRNAERELGRFHEQQPAITPDALPENQHGNVDDDKMHWAHRAGMIAQQTAAMDNTEAGREHHARKLEERKTRRSEAYYVQRLEPACEQMEEQRRDPPLEDLRPAMAVRETTDRRAETKDRQAEVTDTKAATSDLDIERARFAAALDRSMTRQRGETERDRDGGREL